MRYWLFKTEPDSFSIDDLAHRPDGTEGWDGVRNYQARNFMRDQMNVNDLAFIYHSSCKVPGIAGLAKVSQTALVDPTQFEPESKYYDPKATLEQPRWHMVALTFVEKFNQVLPLSMIKQQPNITELGLVQKGARLSIMPVAPNEFEWLLELARKP
ncbi:MAG: EVE domain-containing protein [Alteromonadaceae bacterium]|nr:EVE domain-containing protein [Alteromonadaceae bacterium]